MSVNSPVHEKYGTGATTFNFDENNFDESANVNEEQHNKRGHCCQVKCCKNIRTQRQPTTKENVFTSDHVPESKNPKKWRILESKIWDALFICSCLASFFLFTFCEGFLNQSRSLWGFIHIVNAVYTILLLEQWVRIISKQNSLTKVDIFFSILSVLPIDLIVLLVHSISTESGSNPGQDHLMFTISRLHYCFRIKNILNYLSSWENQLRLGDFSSFLLRILLYTCFLLHTFACVWHRLACNSFRNKHFLMDATKARKELCVPDSWIMKLSERALLSVNSTEYTPFLQGSSGSILWDHYIVSLYWSTGTSFRLGYSDLEINMARNYEVVLTAICQIVSWIFVLAVVSGTLTSLLIESDTERESYLTRRFAIRHYLMFSKVGKYVIHEVQKFYDYLWNKRKGVSELMLLDFMPANMKAEIFFDIHSFVLEQMPFFEGLDSSFLMTLSVRMTHSFHLQEEILFQKNERGYHMFYVLKGHLEIMSDDESHAIACIKSGSCIGDVFLLHPYSHCCTVRCGSDCDILSLTRKNVTEVLEDYPQYFHVLQNRIQERFEQCALLLNLASRYHEAPQLFEKLRKMPVLDVATTNANFLDEKVKKLKFNAATAETNGLEIPDSDGLSLNSSIVDKMSNMYLSALAKKDKKLGHKRSLQEEAYSALASDMNRTYLLAQNLGICLPNLTVTTPMTITVKDSKENIISGDAESLFTKLVNMPIINGEERSSLVLCWKLFVSICIMIALFYYPYQFAFRSSKSDLNIRMNSAMHLTDIIFAIDCCFDMLQFVVTPQRTLETVPQILAYRIRCVSFYVRVFAFLPIEYIFGWAVTSDFGTSPYMYLLKLNRALEIIVLRRFFQDLEGASKIPIMAVFLSKFLLIVLYVIHLFAVLYEFMLRDLLTPVHLKKFPYRTYEFALYWSTQIVTTAGFGDLNYRYLTEVVLLCLAFVTGTLAITYLSAKLAAVLVNTQRRRVTFKQTYYGVTEFLKQRKFPEDLARRIKAYYRMQWKAHQGVLIPRARSAIWDAPDAIVSDVCLAQSLWLISRVPIFKHLTETVLVCISKALKQYFVPPDECVLFERDKRRELYMIVKGFCNVHSGTKFVGHLSDGNYFGLSGLIMGVNQNYRITTETHCLFFCLQYEDFVDIANTHKFLKKDYKILRGEAKFTKYEPTRTLKNETVEELNEKTNGQRMIDGTLNNKFDTEPSLNFQVIKKPHKSHQIIRYFLLRRTVIPSGLFMICWMTFRVITGIISSYYVLAHISFGFNTTNSFIIVLFFDVIAWLDLYIMLHVAYYNDLNQLVTDPVKTALHYVKGPFIIDLLFCFPFDLLGLVCLPHVRIFASDYHGHYRLITYLRLNRVFQPYKLVQMGVRLNKIIFKSLTFITLLETMPWMLLFTHIVACMAVFLVCDVSPNGNNFNCSLTAWLTHGTIYEIPTRRTINSTGKFLYSQAPELDYPWKMYLISCYWTIATALRVGFGDINLLTTTNRMISVFVIMSGVLVATYLSSKLTACMVGEDSRRIEIRTKVDIMLSFLERFKATHSVQRRVKEIYYNEWDKTKGISIDNLFVALHPSLKADVYCHLYEESIRQSPLLKNVDEPGIRMLSSILKEVFLLEGEYIFQYGDITDEIFLISNGIVAAYNQQGNVMSYMSAGSLIGEMSAVYGITRLYTAVAMTDTSTLVFSATDFKDFLDAYPDIKVLLERLCLHHYHELLGQGVLTNSTTGSLPNPFEISERHQIGSQKYLSLERGKTEGSQDGSELNKAKVHGMNALLDPLRVPLRRDQLKDKDKELLLQDTSTQKNTWWTIFITFGHVPKTEMGSVLHIYQDQKRCNILNFVIHPSSTVVRSSGWTVFNLLITAISCALTSYEISFMSSDHEAVPIYILRYLAELFFVIRIIGNFHLGYLDDAGEVVADIKKIAKRYVSRLDGFVLDTLTTIPFYVISHIVGGPNNALYATNIRGIQLLRVVLFVRYLGETETDLSMKASEVKILKITILLCFIFHFCACAWYLVACYGMVCDDESWMTILLHNLQSRNDIRNETDITIVSRYWISLAYVTTTITACGLGNVTPRSAIELIATISFIFGTVFVIGFLLGEMTQCLASQISRKIHYEHELSVVQTHLAGLGLNKSKRDTVAEYYKLVWRRFRGMPYFSLLNEFPHPLRSDISFEVYGPNLKNVRRRTEHVTSLYSRILGQVDEQILRQITSKIRHEFYLPGGHIVRSGNVCDAVYFIKRGEVLIIDENKGIELCVRTLYENDCFGEIKILLPRVPFRFSYVASQETEVGMLHRDDLEKVLKLFPNLRNDLVEKARKMKAHRNPVREQDLQHVLDAEKGFSYMDSPVGDQPKTTTKFTTNMEPDHMGNASIVRIETMLPQSASNEAQFLQLNLNAQSQIAEEPIQSGEIASVSKPTSSKDEPSHVTNRSASQNDTNTPAVIQVVQGQADQNTKRGQTTESKKKK